MNSYQCLLAVLILLASACGGSGSPTTPSPPTTPVVQPVTVAFTPATTSPVNRSLSLRPFPSVQPGAIAIQVWAQNFVPGASATAVRIELRVNPEFFQWGDVYQSGTYLEQGGALVSYDVFHDDTEGTVEARIDRPDSLPGATGSGIVLTFRLHAKPGIRSGSSPVQFNDTNVYDPDFSDSLARTYAGTVTIQ